MSDEDTMPPLRERLARIIFERRSRRLGLRSAWDEWPDKSRFLDEADDILAATGIVVTELPAPTWGGSDGRYYGYGDYVGVDVEDARPPTKTGRVFIEDWVMEPSEAIDLAAALLAAANKAKEGRA